MTLSSNAVCVPLVFDCIVGAVDVPSGTQLVDTQCLSPFWNHLIVFRDHCLKQVLHAGHRQHFRMAFRTTQQTGDVVLAAEFGRGVLPWVFQRLASAQLTVDLDTGLTLAQDCGDEPVASGASFSCTATVAYPVPPGATPPDITSATLTDTPDTTLFPGGSGLGTTSPDWSCPAGTPNTTCTLTGTISAGESHTFTWNGQAAVSSTGGSGDNRLDLSWTAPLSGTATSTEPITVQGSSDTSLTITKTGTSSSVRAGQTATWSVTVTNSGPVAAQDVRVVDLTQLVSNGVGTEVAGSVITYTSGVGTWTCSAGVCETAVMPVGSVTFTVTTPVPALSASATLVNEAGVSWSNDILGPEYAEWVGAAMAATVASDTTVPSTTPTTTPTTTGPASPAPISFAG